MGKGRGDWDGAMTVGKGRSMDMNMGMGLDMSGAPPSAAQARASRQSELASAMRALTQLEAQHPLADADSNGPMSGGLGGGEKLDTRKDLKLNDIEFTDAEARLRAMEEMAGELARNRFAWSWARRVASRYARVNVALCLVK